MFCSTCLPRRDRRANFPRSLLVGALAVAALLTAPTARAQTAQGFSLDRFEPAGAGSRWFTLESLDFRGASRLALSLTGDYAAKPLVLFGPDDRERAVIVEDQLFLHVGAGLNLMERFRVNVSLPVLLHQTGETHQAGTIRYAAASGAAIGDLRMGADVRLVGDHGGAATLALGIQVFAPTGSRDSYASDGKVRLAPRALLAGDLGVFAYAARLGFQYRTKVDESVFQGEGASIGSELTGALALGIKPTDRLLLGPEIFGSTVLSDGNTFAPRSTPVEILLGAHLTVADDWHLGLGASPGITQGLGSPALRVVAQLQYFPAIDEAAPPPAPAPPPPAPIVRDRDGDGVLDGDDACPDEPGRRTEDPQTNGCPIRDRDGDGILDADDACPDVPGMKTDDPKTNGCADKDGDSILDPEDACPEQPGKPDPDPAKNGCPVARVERGQIRILEQVKFKTASHVILRESDYVMEAVRSILEEHPEIQTVRIEGHTDSRGSAAYNKGLSERRARSVMRWLVTRGIDRKRLTSQGFGLERPIDSNDTPEGRAQNRRVEFHITDPLPAGAKE